MYVLQYICIKNEVELLCFRLSLVRVILFLQLSPPVKTNTSILMPQSWNVSHKIRRLFGLSVKTSYINSFMKILHNDKFRHSQQPWLSAWFIIQRGSWMCNKLWR